LGRAVIHRAHLIAFVVTLLIGFCSVLLVVGCSGVRAEASQEEKQGRTEAAKEQEHSGGAAPEGDRCDRTRTIVRGGGGYLTNDLPGCPNKGGLLSAQLPDTGRRKISDPNYSGLMGEKGDDEIRGHSGWDEIYGGIGSDIIYGGSDPDEIQGDNGDDVIHGGDGNEFLLSGGKGDDVIYGGDGNDEVYDDQGEDVLYGGDGNDHIYAGGEARDLTKDGGRDKLYCGAGRDTYEADPNAYVDSSCEMKEPTTASASAPPRPYSGNDVITSMASASPVPVPPSGGPAILLPAAALLVGSGIVTYAILRRR
jgi:hypothetical protein